MANKWKDCRNPCKHSKFLIQVLCVSKTALSFVASLQIMYIFIFDFVFDSVTFEKMIQLA